MANRFWVGGTGTWDDTDTSHWSATAPASPGAMGNAPQSVPVAVDVVTIDANAGGGTITVNHPTLSMSSLTTGAFTGTLDFSINNNNITFGVTGWNNNGTGTRTIKMGNGTWTFTGGSGNPIVSADTGLTLDTGTSTILLNAASSAASRVMTLGTAFTWNAITVNGYTGGFSVTVTNNSKIGTLTLNGPVYMILPATITVTTLNMNGSSGSAMASLLGTTVNTSASVNLSNAVTAAVWASFRDITFVGSSVTATNSIDLGRVNLNGGSITPPSGGSGGGGGVIGVIGS